MPIGSFDCFDRFFIVRNGDEIAITNITKKPEEKDRARVLPGIKQVVFNKNKGYTTVLWVDGTSTVVHCGESDSFERYFGFCAAVIKKLFGSTTAAKNLMEKYDLEREKERKEQERLRKVQAQLDMERKNRERKELERINTQKKDHEVLDKMKSNKDDFFKALLDMMSGGDTDGD